MPHTIVILLGANELQRFMQVGLYIIGVD